MIARKIRVYPTATQRAKLARWFGAARWTYNQCLAATEQQGVSKNKKALRTHCINAGPRVPTYIAEVPYDVRDEAMNDLLKAYDVNFKKGMKFKMRFRSKKRSATECIAVLKKHWNRTRGMYADVLNAQHLRSSESLPESLPADSRLIRTKLGRFYLCIPQPMVIESTTNAGVRENQATPAVRVASIDPGVRTFATVYSTNGEVTEWGVGDAGRIQRLCASYDRLQSRWTRKGVRSASRYRMRRAGLRIQERIRGCVNELHRKLALYLCRHHDVILLPTFRSQEMVTRRGCKGKQRVIGSRTARAMCTWSHYRFQQHVIQKARAYPGCLVVLVSEAYTSKTCGRCGHLNRSLGSSKVFRCSSETCDFVCDRDVNGARNVLLRTLAPYVDRMECRAL